MATTRTKISVSSQIIVYDDLRTSVVFRCGISEGCNLLEVVSANLSDCGPMTQVHLDGSAIGNLWQLKVIR